MKKFISSVLLSACIASSALAGGHDGDKFRPHGPGDFMPLHKLAKVLDLSDEQKAELKALREEMRENRPERNPENSVPYQFKQLDPSASDYQQNVEQLADISAENARERFLKMAEMRVKIEAILSPEQVAKLKILNERKDRKHSKKDD